MVRMWSELSEKWVEVHVDTHLILIVPAVLINPRIALRPVFCIFVAVRFNVYWCASIKVSHQASHVVDLIQERYSSNY